MIWDLTLSWRRSLSNRNQSIDLQRKSVDWFLYDRDHRHERIKRYAQKHTLPRLLMLIMTSQILKFMERFKTIYYFKNGTWTFHETKKFLNCVLKTTFQALSFLAEVTFSESNLYVVSPWFHLCLKLLC